MKKIVALLLAAVTVFALAACGSTNDKASAPADLTGEWKQTNSNSKDAWQAATISGDTITVYWISDNGDTKSLYWAGTYTAPTTADEPYTWTSENDHEQTDFAMLASTADTKDFTYKNGVLSFEASALGSTMTIKMEKQ